MADLGKMSKKQLETYAREELGIELDRRHNKKQLISTVEKHLKAKKSQPKVVKVVEPPPAPKKSEAKPSEVRKIIQELSLLRRDASIVWDEIKDDTHSDEDIRELCRAKGYGTLVQEIS